MAGNSRVSDAFIVHPSVGYAQIGTHVLPLYFLFLTGILVCYPLPLEYTFPPLWCKDGFPPVILCALALTLGNSL
jgi:hypothetical protein